MVHVLTAALRAAHLVRLLCGEMFGDVLGALEIFPALLAAVFVDRHGFLRPMRPPGQSRSRQSATRTESLSPVVATR